MGQEIQFLSRKLPGDPIVAIEDLVNTRAKIAEQRLKKTDKNLAAATKRIKTVEENQRRRIIREVNQESLSQAKTWDDFVQAIQC